MDIMNRNMEYSTIWISILCPFDTPETQDTIRLSHTGCITAATHWYRTIRTISLMMGMTVMTASTTTAAAPMVFLIRTPEPSTICAMAPAPCPSPGMISIRRFIPACPAASA